MSRDIYAEITDKIVNVLESGERPWVKPWSAEHAAGHITRPLRACGEPYRGINVLNLWMEAMNRGFSAPIWVTYKQAQALGGQVRKGESGSLCVKASTYDKKITDRVTGEDKEIKSFYMKGYTVFNAEQVDGLPEKFYALDEPPVLTKEERLACVDEFFTNTGAEIKHGGSRAYYSVSTDHIQMPIFEAFRDKESYYATLAHEATHWTKHKTRLDRDLGRKSWGDEGYAMEELVAELGSAFLSVDLGITPEVREDHAAYIGSWLKVLKNDKKAIFTASSHAQKAADLLCQLGKH
jgi:antirestriction protein ArdC